MKRGKEERISSSPTKQSCKEVLTYLTVPKPRLTMIRSIQANARFTAETNSATRIKPFAVVEGEGGREGGREGGERDRGRNQ